MNVSKNKSLLVWGLLFPAILFFIACGNTAPARNETGQALEMGPPLIETVSLEQSVYLYPDRAESSPRLGISLSLLNISGFTVLQKNFQDIFYKGLSPDDYIKEFTKTISTEYQAQKVDEPRESLNWSYREIIALCAETPGALVVSLDREYYTGGAHGITERNYFVFDLSNGNRLLLTDILEADAMPSLQKLAEGELRKALDIPPRLPLTEKDFFNDSLDILYDFYMSSKGIGVQWDPYEIAPYAMGAMEILVPTQLVEGLLNPLGLSLIKDFS
jgi:hypothetical protein